MSSNESGGKSKRPRSPNFPAISLAEALPRITQIYEKEFNHPADSDTLAKALGYSGTNGASDSVISAMKKYGLLENAGNREYKLSESAIDICLHEKGSPERVKAIVEAAFTPPLFAELHDEYGNNLPSENNLRVKLIKRGFTPKSVGDVIRSYRDTLELVSQEAPAYNAAVTGNTQEDPKPARETLNMQSPTGAVQQTASAAVSALPTAPPVAATGEKMLVYPISRNSEARIFFNGQVTQEAISKLSALLELSKDTFPTKEELERPQPRAAMWRNKDHDQPVTVTGEAGEHEGRRYVNIEGSEAGVPEDEIEYT